MSANSMALLSIHDFLLTAAGKPAKILITRRSLRPRWGVSLIIERVLAYSTAEVDGLKKKGYAIVAMSCFLPDGAFTYTLEKGSKWSRGAGE